MMKAVDAPKSVLFVCYLNSIRSPMAEGLMRKIYPKTHAESCGMASGDLDDLMVAVMREKGVDMSEHQAQTLGDFAEQNFDLVIAFTKEAGEAARAAFAGTHKHIEVWPVADPSQGSLDVRAIMNNYRAIRDTIEARLKRAFVE
jgi:protein-tyrosine-phosphatase